MDWLSPATRASLILLRNYLWRIRKIGTRNLQMHYGKIDSPAKKSIGTSPYELVYGIEAVFASSLGVPVMTLLQEAQVEPIDIQGRINQTIHL